MPFLASLEDVVAEVRFETARLKTGALRNAIFDSADFWSIATEEEGVLQRFEAGADKTVHMRSRKDAEEFMRVLDVALEFAGLSAKPDLINRNSGMVPSRVRRKPGQEVQ